MYKSCTRWIPREKVLTEKVKGSSMTVQGLAPSLEEIIRSNMVNNEPLPYTGTPIYDESDNAGIARVNAREMTLDELREVSEISAREKEAAEAAAKSGAGSAASQPDAAAASAADVQKD